MIDEKPFSVLYDDSPASRPNTPVNVIVGSLIIQQMFKMSDDYIIESLMFDVRLQLALHTSSFKEQPLSDKTLSRFRRRCYEYEIKTGIDLLHNCISNLSSGISKLMNISGKEYNYGNHIRLLSNFFYVAKYGSFSKAADALLRGQPNITKTINNLESQLGCKLFIRSNRGVHLTLEGEKLFKHAEIAFENLSMAENEIISERNLDGGLISIATTEIGLYGSLLPALTAFNHDYPNVKIRLSSLNSPQAMDAVKNGVADFAVITLHEKPNPIFLVQKLEDFTEPLCCKKGYLDRNPGDVFSLPYISVNRNSYTYKFYKEYLISCGISKEPDFEVSAADQVLPLVKAGMGIGFVSRYLAEGSLEDGSIEEIQLPVPLKKRSICLIEDANRCLSLASRKFIEYLYLNKN